MSHIARNAAKTVYQARWWIVAASVLCFADQAIRAYLFHLEVKRFIYAFIFYSALAVAPAFLLGRRTSRLLSSVLFPVWLLLEALQFWVAFNFNMALGGGWILMLLSTSAAEIHQFAEESFTFYNVVFIMFSIAAVVALGWFMGRKRQVYPALSLTSVVLAVFCIALSCLISPKILGKPIRWARFSRDLLALNLPVDTIANWNTYCKLADVCRKEPPFSLSIDKNVTNLCVFIIGESTTRNHMGIYGYPRDTTPGLAAINREGGMTIFTDLVATSSSTPEALCALLTGCVPQYETDFKVVFPAMLKKAGYRTVLISCQGHWQNKDVVGSHLFLSCDKRIFLQGNRSAGTKEDGIVLPAIEKTLGENSGNLALFVHLYGCHEPTRRRIPHGFRRKWAVDTSVSKDIRRKIDSYDTAMAYNDQVVSSIMRMIASQNVSSCVMYVSDHGESPSSPLWRDVKSRDTFEIPLLIWLSPEYERRYPGTASSVSTAKRRRLRLDQLIEGMLELAQVKGYSDRHSTGNFLAPQFYGTDALREENK